MMQIITGCDATALRAIAKASGSASAVSDCNFLRLLMFSNLQRMYAERIDGTAYLFGYVKTTKHELRIVSIAVAEACKGQGYGTLLMRRAINYAKAHDLRAITTRTQPSAVSYYRRFGFAVTEHTDDDEYIMYKYLRE